MLPMPLSLGFEFYEGLSALDSFNPDYLPSSYFYPYVERILNPENWKRQLSHKGMLELAYSVGVKHPQTVLRTFGGVYLDKNYKSLTREEALKVISECDFPLLYKPATDSEQGAGIRLFKPEDVCKLYDEIKSDQIFDNGIDFVIQRAVSQSDETRLFNPTSLNCMRVTTLNLNGEISVCSMALKCGPKDSVVDNIGSGKRGVMVGLSNDGTVADKGFYGNGETAESHNGVTFAGKRIDSFPKVVDAALALHRYTPKCAIIGWDLAIDSDNTPVLIEGNTVYPGISIEQMCSGPIFGNRTKEVADYIRYRIGDKKMGGGKLL